MATSFHRLELISGIRGIVAPDANFAYLETIISDRTDRVADALNFTFQSSSDGLRYAVSVGIHVLTVTNNHSADCGADGILGITRHHELTLGLKVLAGTGNILRAGLRNLDRYSICKDLGLFAKAYYWKEASGQRFPSQK